MFFIAPHKSAYGWGGLWRGKGKRGSWPKVLLEGLRVPLTLTERAGRGGSGGHKSSYGDNKKQSLK